MDGWMSTSSAADLGHLPIACTLGPDDGPARMRRWRALVDTAHPIASREGRTLELRFDLGAGVHAELVDLAAAEQECCPFVVWTVTEVDGHPALRVVANPDSPDDVAPIAALLGA